MSYPNLSHQFNINNIWDGNKSSTEDCPHFRQPQSTASTQNLPLPVNKWCYMVKEIWTYILDTWKLCNQHLHQHGTPINLPNYRQAAISLIKQCHQLPPDAQEALYHQPLEMILDLPEPRLQQWVQKAINISTNNSKPSRNMQHFTQTISIPFFKPKLSATMISNLHRKPCYTAPVWVFFVHISLREITLKMLSFLLGTHHQHAPLSRAGEITAKAPATTR